MLAQAAGLALLAALSPAALLVIAVYLGSARPRQTALSYLAGAVLMSTVIAVAALVVLHGAGLSRPSQHTPRYGLRLGLGLLLIVAAVVVEARRRRRRSAPRKQGGGLVSRLVAAPTPASAFAVGVLLFAPGVTFLGAVQVIATAKESVGLVVLGTAIVIAIDVMLIWLPLVFYLAAPGWTEHRLKVFNGWLRANGSLLLAGALLVAGAILASNGIYGLSTAA